MKFSENWLREWVNPKISSDELIAQLTMAGLEVDGVEPVAAKFTGVVVGEIKQVEPHPNADKLRVCSVLGAQGETFQVVCGAANARVGLKTPFAQVGAVLSEDFKIKKAKLRGELSMGMLCGADELGLSEQRDGIMELPADAPTGQDFNEYLQLNDKQIDIDLTPNRGDCLSIVGVAREVAVLNNMRFSAPAMETIAATIDESFSVEVSAKDACPRYLGRVIRGVDLSMSTPLWMQERLRRGGIRSIDPAVDVTNYVMLELGQPMHAFDLDTLVDGIQVRFPTDAEKITLLDDSEHVLTNDTLLICDAEKPLAIAGIMGGKGSGVDSAVTKNLFLESAFFAPLAIAGKARSYGLHTESSHRFERGVDSDLQSQAIERATELLLAIVGGEAGPVTEACAQQSLPQKMSVPLRSNYLNGMAGMELPVEQVSAMLQALEMTLEQAQQKADDYCWQVQPPSHRFDIALEADLVEEICRIYGYNNLPTSLPTGSLGLTSLKEVETPLQQIRRLLIARDYQEAICYSFVDAQFQQQFGSVEALPLANPLSSELGVMRTSLLPGLCKALLNNLNRQQTRVRFFETGLRFVPQSNGGLSQEKMISGLLYGSVNSQGWANDDRSVDFYDIKADVEALLEHCGASSRCTFTRGEHPALHPGQQAVVKDGDEEIGHVGAIHPRLQAQIGLSAPAMLFELKLQGVQQGKLAEFSELSKFPEVRRDLAFIVEQNLPVDELVATINETSGSWLCNLTLFDVYQGKGIENNRKSVALGLTWQHPSRTLTDSEVNQWVEGVVSELRQKYGAVLRE